MLSVFAILFGGAFTVAVAWASGSLLLDRLRVSLYREEAALFSFGAGAGLVSLAVFLLCVVQQARVAVFVAAGLAVFTAVYRRRAQPARKSLPALPRTWNIPFSLIFTAFFLMYLVNALAPETSPDGSGYHLGNVMRIYQHHGFVWDYHSMYSSLSEGIEMLFLVAFSIGRHSAATLVHFTFQAVLPLLLVCYGRRFGFPRVGLFAALLIYACPVVGKAGASAYNDLAVATIVFSVFYLLQVWDASREPNLLILIGLLVGFGYAVKYTAALALPFVAGFVWWRSARGSRPWRELGAVVLPAAILILPWMLRNWIWIGDPVAPFASRWFPNPYYNVGMEQLYLEDLRHYDGIQHWWQVPWQVAVRGRGTGGILGPIFLLAPLALLALRRSEGRRTLAAAAVFAIPASFNAGTRFLIPALPFVAIAFGLALEKGKALLPVLAAAHALAGLPLLVSKYSDPSNWRLGSIPVKAAVRLQRERLYLKDHLPDYALKAALETLLPPRARILSIQTRPEAYLNRTFVVAYESAFGNVALDMLNGPVDERVQPRLRQRFRFLPVTTPRVRVVQTASGKGFWSIAELRVYSRGRELPRSGSWRLTAWPNGWDVQLAFDNSYATRWSTWQAMAPGMFLEIDFGKPEVLDEVVLEAAAAPEAKAQIEVWGPHEEWVALSDTWESMPMDVPAGIRRAATRELKARGIGYLLINDTDYLADDMRKYRKFWGLTELTAIPGIHLYQID